MLNLETSIHLEKIKLASHVRIEELNCAGAHVVHAPGNLDRRLAHPLSQIIIVEWRRTFLNHLLVTPLNRAFALAEMDVVTKLVSEDLDFDVTWFLDDLLDVHLGISKSGCGFRPGCFE